MGIFVLVLTTAKSFAISSSESDLTWMMGLLCCCWGSSLNSWFCAAILIVVCSAGGSALTYAWLSVPSPATSSPDASLLAIILAVIFQIKLDSTFQLTHFYFTACVLLLVVDLFQNILAGNGCGE